jgi:hypothetical protein
MGARIRCAGLLLVGAVWLVGVLPASAESVGSCRGGE